MPPSSSRQPNHYVGEWYGQRIYPNVQLDEASLEAMRDQACPFLTSAFGETQKCIKPEPSQGVCTITTNDARRYGVDDGSIDWLVCPYRTLDDGLLKEVARRLFDIAVDAKPLIVAAVTLNKSATQSSIRDALGDSRPVFVYFRAHLGGEISLSRTDRSPEFSFDITMVELSPGSGDPEIGRYAIVEVQTMAFHGSYGKATKALRSALDLHPANFADQVGENPEWAGREIQGPSIADTFKRTFYQMIFKFQLGLHESCAGTVLALPRAVWNSWQPHLGGPELQDDPCDQKLRSLPRPEGVGLTEEATAWILVFDTDQTKGVSPNPLDIDMMIETDTPTLLHHAFDVAPEAAFGGGATERLYADICSKMLGLWPELRRAVAAEDDAPAQDDS